ncbi:uncharacterized protein G2W53_033454 [Senna tora]|uniref:Uncharacterized protein n=1 Tax=Senna tora TaxID=362788 RepID=A0A834W8G2_9FABA|nr:uncharacterized protein G2W53_033454 [Senna tora]
MEIPMMEAPSGRPHSQRPYQSKVVAKRGRAALRSAQKYLVPDARIPEDIFSRLGLESTDLTRNSWPNHMAASDIHRSNIFTQCIAWLVLTISSHKPTCLPRLRSSTDGSTWLPC